MSQTLRGPMYVYFVKAYGQHPMIKIGSSVDPDKRLRTLQCGSALRLKLLGSVRCKDEAHARCIERLAHNIFYKQRRHGEWFRLSASHESQLMSLVKRCAERSDDAP